MDELWNYYFNDILNNYITQFNNKQDFILGGIFFKESVIQFDKNEIQYSNLAIKKYNYYFVIYSQENEYNNKMLYFLKDNDVVLVSSLISLNINNMPNSN